MDEFSLDPAFVAAPSGWKRHALTPVRRVARKLLRPASLRLSELLSGLARRIDAADQGVRDLHSRLDRTDDQLRDTISFGWDYAAMTRRLAALEDRVEALQAAAEAGAARPSLLCHDPENVVARAS